jgi:hypothetical protein
MSKITVRGINEMVSNFNSFTANQAPFAMAKALTDTVKGASKAVTAHIEQVFDKPTPFTKRAMAFTPANKSELKATVVVKAQQASYLVTEMEGGARGFKTFEERFAAGGRSPTLLLPGAGVGLNQYGNISKAKLLRILKDENTSGSAKRFFVGKPKGQDLPKGVYSRVNNNNKITPMLIFATDAQYEKRFKFSEIVNENVNETFVKNFESAWEAAIKTMRR